MSKRTSPLLVVETKAMSVSKSLADLLALPANRSCADCRVTLVDASRVYTSYSPTTADELNDARDQERANLHPNHSNFALLGRSPAQEETEEDKAWCIDPARCCGSARDRGLDHGVFVCAMCAAAHTLLWPGIARVHAIHDVSAWNAENVQQLAQTGNAHNLKTLEAFIPELWNKQHRPKANTGIAERLIFVRAKYEALAFCLPPSGALAKDAWQRILNHHHPEWKDFFRQTTGGGAAAVEEEEEGDTIMDLSDLELNSYQQNARQKSSLLSLDATRGGGVRISSLLDSIAGNCPPTPNTGITLPNRLVDFFCVVSATDQLDPKYQHDNPNLAKKESVDDFLLTPSVTDCYPRPNAYSDMEFPEHAGSFVFPEGCRPSSKALSPEFFTFVLTCADGNHLYGGALKLHDKTMDLDEIKEILIRSGYDTNNIPAFLDFSKSLRRSYSGHYEMAYLPKCLVVLSHYPFLDLWRKFLLQLYRITLVEAPLPIERFIANFVSEIPLPPPGKIEVQFGFTAQEIWTISRPPENELPMANFSYQPLFASLSIGSVMVVVGCLLQETRVVLLSQHYGLLTPVAEALLSFLFPLHWNGMYVPILPYAMLDILDAPMPFLVGLHARYLQDIAPEARPVGVLFVDLDQDVVHLGWNDDNTSSPFQDPRRTPALPEREAARLKHRLASSAACVYVLPDSGKAGTITFGNGKPIPIGKRDPYSVINSSEIPNRDFRRKDVFGNIDCAYGENEFHISPKDFLSAQGVFHENVRKNSPDLSRRNKSIVKRFLQKFPKSADSISSEDSEDLMGSSSMLDLKDPKGFYACYIRNSFFRFMIGIFHDYRQFIAEDGTFQSEAFLASSNMPPRQHDWLKSIVKTQMFESFIQERVDNPKDPEVMFFDVSIDAEQNHLTKAPLKFIKNGGFKDTSFLDDKSSQVTKKFTPPPPSYLGLPDDGRTYHYGSFPTLDKSLFGKARFPMIWQDNASQGFIRRKRQGFFKVQQKHQYLVGQLTNLQRSSVGNQRSGLNLLERCLVILSQPFVEPQLKNKMFGDVANETTLAEEVVLGARRKTMILVAIFVAVQAHSRGFMVRRGCRPGVRFPLAASDDSSVVSGHIPVVLNPILTMTLLASSPLRRRGKNKAAKKIQKIVRLFLQRRRYWRISRGFCVLQAQARARLVSLAYRMLLIVVSKVQATFRGRMIRRKVFSVLSTHLVVFRRHIFLLWKLSQTSLVYRTKMWTAISQVSFLRHNLAIFELQRLWDELQLCKDTTFRDGMGGKEYGSLLSELGISNAMFAACFNLGKTLELVEGGGKGDTPDGDDSPKFNSSFVVAGERAEIYKRLSEGSVLMGDRYMRFYDSCLISVKDKKRKRKLADAVWKTFDRADESAALMYLLFPELQYSDTVGSANLSGNGSKKVQFDFSKLQRDSTPGAQQLLHERVRQNVSFAASVALCIVPRLLDQLPPRKELVLIRRKEAVMRARGFRQWRECRIFLMIALARNKLSGHAEAHSWRQNSKLTSLRRYEIKKKLAIPIHAWNTSKKSVAKDEWRDTSKKSLGGEWQESQYFNIESVLCNCFQFPVFQ